MTDTLRRMARAIDEEAAVLSGCDTQARAALLAVRPLDREVERAVALTGCYRGVPEHPLCQGLGQCVESRISGRQSYECNARARRSVGALIEAILGEKVT